MVPVSGEAFSFVLALKGDVFLYEIDGLKSKVKMWLRQEPLHRKAFGVIFSQGYFRGSFSGRGVLLRGW